MSELLYVTALLHDDEKLYCMNNEVAAQLEIKIVKTLYNGSTYTVKTTVPYMEMVGLASDFTMRRRIIDMLEKLRKESAL